MSEKYAKEMILVPKPPEDTATTQAGGQAADEGMAQFWKRRLLVDELAHAPHVDKMMKIMEDMKESEGRALPPSVPDYGLGSSDYYAPNVSYRTYNRAPSSRCLRTPHVRPKRRVHHHLKSLLGMPYLTPFKRPSNDRKRWIRIWRRFESKPKPI